MNFPHAEYASVVRAARKDARIDVQASVLDYRVDIEKKKLLYVKVRLLGRIDVSDFTDGGTAEQRDDADQTTFMSNIVTMDESTGEIVVEVEGNSPMSKPDPARYLILNPPDFLKALDNFASEIAKNPAGNQEERFVHLNESLVQCSAPAQCARTGLKPSQNAAVNAALGNPFTFIWGPPGTGKSFTLGHLAAELRKAGKKILVLAHTNAAVDVTTFAIDNACVARGEQLRDAELIRYTRTLSNLAEYKRRSHLLAFTRLLENLMNEETELRSSRAEVQGRLEVLPPNDPGRANLAIELAQIELRIASVGARRKEEIARLLAGASIICASITSCLFGQLMESFKFDAVLLDEASLVPLAVWPWLLHPWHANCEPQFTVAGDPMQLQPIFKRRQMPGSKFDAVSIWFETNIYARLGINSMTSAKALMDGGTLVFLNEQFRMARGIREAVSRTFYGGRLIGDAARLLPHWTEESGVPNGELVVVDPVRCTALPAANRVRNLVGKNTNAKSMDVALAIVRRIIAVAKNGFAGTVSILIVTPFRNQSLAYEKRVMAMAKPKNVIVRASTVHRCQGSEADIVIFDLVDAGNWFVTKPGAVPLWCVACSRAKSQLFLIGDEAGMRSGRISQLMINGRSFTAIS